MKFHSLAVAKRRNQHEPISVYFVLIENTVACVHSLVSIEKIEFYKYNVSSLCQSLFAQIFCCLCLFYDFHFIFHNPIGRDCNLIRSYVFTSNNLWFYSFIVAHKFIYAFMVSPNLNSHVRRSHWPNLSIQFYTALNDKHWLFFAFF